MLCSLESIAKDAGYLQELRDLKNSQTLIMIVMNAWKIACMLGVKLVEEVLEERSNKQLPWPECPECGARIESKGRADRQIKTLLGIVHWQRKIGRCPKGCKIGQVVPLDEELGIYANQRVCDSLKRIGCALAVFVPYETSAVLLSLLTTITVSSASIWCWVQELGEDLMDMLFFELFVCFR